MEEVHLPSHLVEELEQARNYRFKYRDNTLVAFDNHHIRVLSDFQSLLENSEAPLQTFHKDWTIEPSKTISDAFIFGAGVYTVSRNTSTSFLSGWRQRDTICVFQLEDISDEYTINLDSPIVAHTDVTTSSGDHYLVVLWRNNYLTYYDIKQRRELYKYSLNICINDLVLESVEIFSVYRNNILVIHVNKSQLILIDFDHKDIPLVIDFWDHKLLSVQNIVNTPHILIISQKSEGESADTEFYVLKMFNESEKSSICSEDKGVELPVRLENSISDADILDVHYIEALNSTLILVKTEEDNLELYNLKVVLEEGDTSSHLYKYGSKELARGQQNITKGQIVADSVFLNRQADQFSVNVELFIADKIRLFVHEFTSEDYKFSQRSVAELFFNTVNLPKELASRVINPDNLEVLTKEEVNEIFFSGAIEEIWAEVFATENGEFKHNLAKLKSFIDAKSEEILVIIDNDCSLELLDKAVHYIASLERILKAILERRTIEASMNMEKLKQITYKESDAKDIAGLLSEIEKICLSRKRVVFMREFIKNNVFAAFENKIEVINKKFHLRKLNKANCYKKEFDDFLKRYILEKPLFIEMILQDAELKGLYPFENKSSLFKFMSQTMSSTTFEYVLIYLVLDTYDGENFGHKLEDFLQSIEGYEECLSYWNIDSSYEEYSSQKAVSEKLSNSLEALWNNDKLEIEYPSATLQAFHELKASDQYSAFRGCHHLFYKEESRVISASGNIKDLKSSKASALSMLIYSLCKANYYKQAELLLIKLDKDTTFCSPAFMVFAQCWIKDGKLKYLLDASLTEAQQDAVKRLLQEEEDIIKYFLDPYFASKDPKAVMNKKYQISKSFFSDKDQELIDELAKYEEFISKKRNAALEEENTPSRKLIFYLSFCRTHVSETFSPKSTEWLWHYRWSDRGK